MTISNKKAQEIAREWHGGRDVEITKVSHGLLDRVEKDDLVGEIERLLHTQTGPRSVEKHELRLLRNWARAL